MGIHLKNNATLNTISGDITLTGQGGSGTNSSGIEIINGGVIQATGAGNITLNGTGIGNAADIFFDSLSFTKSDGILTFNDTVQGNTLLSM